MARVEHQDKYTKQHNEIESLFLFLDTVESNDFVFIAPPRFNTSHLDASLIVSIHGNGFEPKARYWKTRGDRLRRLSSRTTLEWSYDDV